MKKPETIAQMDEIVFEKRNKMYGAYILRKMYSKQVNKALLLSIGILLAGLAYPFVLSYNTSIVGPHVWENSGTVVLTNDPPPKDLPELPVVPPDNSEMQKQVRFVPPMVVEGEVPEDGGFINQDILNQTSVNDPIDLKVEKYVEKPVEVIETSEKDPPVLFAEEMPSFPGGDTERLKYLGANIKYPQPASELDIQGTVYLQFVVDSNGNITDVKILRGIGGGCEEEALRVIKMMPPWHPAKQNGRSVRVLYTMPVSFKLQG